MRNLLVGMWLLCSGLNSGLAAEPTGAPLITPEQAPANVGKRVVVQGRVVSVRTNVAGFHYLNFGADPKNQPFRAMVFPKDTGKFPGLSRYQGKRVKVRGVLRKYKGRVMIQLVNPNQIQGP